MEKVTAKFLETQAERINKMLGAPVAAYTRQADGSLRSNPGHYYISKMYGGVALYLIEKTGGESDVFKMGHIRKSELSALISAFIIGLEVGQAAEPYITGDEPTKYSGVR